MNEKIHQKLTKIGYSIRTFMGEGLYGKVYDIGNNHVLKITSDKSEIFFSQILKNKKLKNVCRIYRVFKFKSSYKFYFIEQEKLQALNTKLILPWSGEITSSNCKLRLAQSKNRAKYIIENFKNIDMLKNALHWAKNNFEDFVFFVAFFLDTFDFETLNEIAKSGKYDKKMLTGNIFNFVHNIEKASNEVIHLKELCNGLEELNKAGIDFWDTHYNNTLKRNNTWVWVDIGGSDIKNTGEIEIVENMNFNLRKKKYL
jgi:hypothetical protein